MARRVQATDIDPPDCRRHDLPRNRGL